jgi:hypothetical protein
MDGEWLSYWDWDASLTAAPRYDGYVKDVYFTDYKNAK